MFAWVSMRKATYKISAHLSEAANEPPRATVDPQRRELWDVLDALASCRADYNLTSNTISVLRALISFLPKAVQNAPSTLFVWPSNDALCARANAMDERTLRRHLNRLCEAGLIARRSSPNGKRFALRIRKEVVNAFGFSLEPLTVRRMEILDAADSLKLKQEQLHRQRAEILSSIHTIRTCSFTHLSACLTAEDEIAIRKLLRRSSSTEELAQATVILEQFLPGRAEDSALLAASNRQNDRHQQSTDEESIKSVLAEAICVSSDANEQIQTVQADQTESLTLEDCLEAASESIAFSSEPVRNWRDLMRLAETLAPMIGVDRELLDHSKRTMGPLPAAISILCVIQRSNHIKRPAAYLRRLAILAGNGLYSLKSLVRAAQRQQFAAANQF